MSDTPNQSETANEIPSVDAADVLMGSETEPVGSRVPEHLSRGPRPRPRPKETLKYFAELVRGTSWTLSYGDGPLVFPKGGKVAISESEKVRLEEEGVDRITFGEPFVGRVERTVAKFVFYDFTTRKKLPPRTYEDVQIDAAPGADPFAVAQREADMEGVTQDAAD